MDYHSHRFKDYSLMVYKNKSLIAQLPANIKDDALYSHQGLTYGGLVLSNNIKLSDVIEAFGTLLKFLDNNYIKTLYLKQIPDIYCSYPSAEIDYIMFKTQADLYKSDVLSVISHAEDGLKFSKDRKEGIKRGIKNNLSVIEEDDFQPFWNDILVPNLEKKHKVKPVHSLDEITLLKKKFPNNIKLYNVYKDDNLVAGTVIFDTENVAHSQYISGNEDKNKLGSLDFLHDYLLNNIYKSKPYFDFGISHEKDGRINKGLLYWKEGFGARSVIQNFYSINTENHTLLNSVFK